MYSYRLFRFQKRGPSPPPVLSTSYPILSDPMFSQWYCLFPHFHHCPSFFFVVIVSCFSISITILLLLCARLQYVSMSPFSYCSFFFLPHSYQSKPVVLVVVSHPVWPSNGFCWWPEAAGSPSLNLHPLPTPHCHGYSESPSSCQPKAIRCTFHKQTT